MEVLSLYGKKFYRCNHNTLGKQKQNYLPWKAYNQNEDKSIITSMKGK